MTEEADNIDADVLTGQHPGPGIGIVINTFNEAENLPRCLEAVKGFDDVLVVDMESTDGTPELARKAGARVVTFPRGENNVCEAARDFAIHRSLCEWVLVVDADEIVTPQLRQYLYDAIKSNPSFAGLSLPFRNHFMGRAVHNGHTEYHVRFMRRDSVNWPTYVHARPVIDGRTRRVPDRDGLRILHFNDLPMSRRIDKQNRYTDNEVPKKMRRRFGWWKLWLRPGWFFVRTFLFDGGWRDGRRGLIRSYMAMFYQVQLMAKVIERQEPDGNTSRS